MRRTFNGESMHTLVYFSRVSDPGKALEERRRHQNKDENTVILQQRCDPDTYGLFACDPVPSTQASIESFALCC